MLRKHVSFSQVHTSEGRTLGKVSVIGVLSVHNMKECRVMMLWLRFVHSYVLTHIQFTLHAGAYIMNIHRGSYLSRADVRRLMRRHFTAYAEDN